MLFHRNVTILYRSRVGVATLNGKLYAFGGFNGSERLSTVEVYDPKTKAWYQGKAMLCKRSAVGVSYTFFVVAKSLFSQINFLALLGCISGRLCLCLWLV